jgi:hypothetical protein
VVVFVAAASSQGTTVSVKVQEPPVQVPKYSIKYAVWYLRIQTISEIVPPSAKSAIGIPACVPAVGAAATK